MRAMFEGFRIETKISSGKIPTILYDIYEGNRHVVCGYAIREQTEDEVISHAKKVIRRLPLPVFTAPPGDRLIKYD